MSYVKYLIHFFKSCFLKLYFIFLYCIKYFIRCIKCILEFFQNHVITENILRSSQASLTKPASQTTLISVHCTEESALVHAIVHATGFLQAL